MAAGHEDSREAGRRSPDAREGSRDAEAQGAARSSGRDASDGPLVSVVVPAYDTEGTLLDRCLRSLLGQDLEAGQLEVVLVDDGSDDGVTPGLCDAWGARDPRVRVLHKGNGGLSDARNHGAAAARGAWIGFVDSDDYVAPWMFSTLLADLETTGADIATCDVVDSTGDEPARFSAKGSVEPRVMGAEQAVAGMARSQLPRVWVPTRLYPRRVFDEGFSFPVGLTYEDAYTIVDIFSQVRSVSSSAARLYCYYHHEGTITTAPYGPRSADMIEAWEHGRALARERFPRLDADFAFRCWWARSVVLDKMVRAGGYDGSPEERELVSYLRENYAAVKGHPAMTRKRRLSAEALRVSLPLYRALVRRLS